jgi:hypothetical protein
MTKRVLSESAGRVVRQSDGSFRICIVNEGRGSSADWPRDFFEGERGRANADVLKGAISFPNHPKDYDRPEERDPMTAIGRVGREVSIEEHDGKMGFWADYIPSKRAGVAEHLEEFGDKLGVSVFCEGETRKNLETNREEAVSLDPTDPYCSVDVVVVAGRGGKFAKQLAESHRRFVEEASATPQEEEEENHMDKEIEERLNKMSSDFTSALNALADKLKAPAAAEVQANVDKETVDNAVNEALADYDKAVDLITEAKLTESQSSDLRARARKGEDITGAVETAKKVLAEARQGRGDGVEVTQHIGGSTTGTEGLSFDVPGFGRVVS